MVMNPPLQKVSGMGRIAIQFDTLRKRKAKSLGRKDLTLERIALETELSYATILRWSKGQITRFDEDTLVRLLEYFDADLSDLLVYEPESE